MVRNFQVKNFSKPNATSTPSQKRKDRTPVKSPTPSKSQKTTNKHARKTPKKVKGDQNTNRSRRRMKIGIRALQEIKYYQSTTHTLIPKLSFCRLVRELMQQQSRHDFRIQGIALEAMQEALETFIVRFFEDSQALAIHAGRITLMLKDMQMLRYLKSS